MPLTQIFHRSRPVVDPGHRVGLNQILGGVAHVVDDAEVRLQDGLAVPEPGREPELVAVRRASCREIRTGGDVNLVEHVIAEVVPVRSHARFFVRIHGERRRKVLLTVLARQKRVHVRRVRGVVQDDERGIHVTRCLYRR